MSLFNFRNCCYGDSKASGVDKDLPQSHEDSLLGLRVDLIKKACALAFKAHKSPKKYYLLEKKNRSWLEADLIIISFHGSWASSDWFVDKSYGVTKINQQLFPSLKSIGNDEAALVNEAFQLRFESILSNSSLKHEPIFSSILQLFNPKSKSSGTDSETDRVISEFYSTVMRNTATVTSYVISNLMDDTNLLLETLPNLVDLSPYRPFGNFIFCAADQPPVVVRNSDVVLQLLFYTARINDMSEVSDVSKKSIMQHLRYEVEFQQSFEISNVVYLDQLEELSLAADGDSFGLFQDTKARLRLRAAGEWQKQKYKNEEKVNREFNEKAAATMKHLKDYKETCEISYYDAFKVHKDERDFKANVKRLELAGVWDHIMEMLKKYELPDEFESKAEWIERGTMYRTLVEPLDVANYYRHFKDKDGGPYMDKGSRPKRYRYLQRWLEHAGRMKSEDDYSESCFWAELEELWKEINDNNGSFEDVKERVLKLETRIKEWFEKGKLDKDVLFEGSTLVNWWKALPPNHKKESPIRSLVEMSRGINMQ
ncbi:protein EDS1L isoform X3 [Arachis hypogaea]|uniref:protein EDS1L isoform X3 n=1 Tax=Arachis hypogaea TaxID=3818 RepID=UPI003B213450